MKKRRNKRPRRIDKVIVVNVTPKKRKIRILDLEEGPQQPEKAKKTILDTNKGS